MIQFKKMTVYEFNKFKSFSTENYAKALKRNLKITYRLALEMAVKESEESMPKGFYSEGHHFQNIIEKESGEKIGFLWYYKNAKRSSAFVYDIWLEENMRSRGLSVEIFKKLEKDLSRDKITYLRLNVFADNNQAIKSYLNNGFEVCNSIMQKIL